jgi:biopolymer transport protein ExbD
MARIFRRQRTAQPIADLNITNLVDLGFTLLIIFMISAQFIQQEQTIPLSLPVDATRPQQKPPPDTQFQSVSIDRAGNYFFGEKRVGWTELSSNLAGIAARPKPPVLRLRIDEARPYREVAKLLGEIQRHNLTKIQFDTQTPK